MNLTKPTTITELRLPHVIGDHMVLQCDLPVRLWGWATPGESVTVTVYDRHATAVAGVDGTWRVVLEPMAASHVPFAISFASGGSQATIEDVVVGELWLCTGQSNMGTPVGAAVHVEDIVAAAETPAIRLCRIPNTGRGVPAADVPTSWSRSSADLAKAFSGVGYVFGYYLQRALEVPIGLIQCQWGGSTLEAWMPRDFMLTEPRLAHQLATFEATADRDAPTWRDPDLFPQIMADSIVAHADWGRTMGTWRQALVTAEAAGDPVPDKPVRDSALPPFNKGAPTLLYNGMLAPLTPMTIRGVIWYQGEANSDHGLDYRYGLRQLIRGWRAHFDQGDFPFFVVQLPSLCEPTADPGAETGWVETRESQWIQPQLEPKVGVTVNYDINPDGDLHPTAKRPVGQRLALAALAEVYGQDLVWRSPSVAQIEFGEGFVTLTCRDVAEGLKTSDGHPPGGFSVAGEDGSFIWATGKIIAPDKIVVETASILCPTILRYAWVNNPVRANLINSADLPLAPFRSDAPPVPQDSHPQGPPIA